MSLPQGTRLQIVLAKRTTEGVVHATLSVMFMVLLQGRMPELLHLACWMPGRGRFSAACPPFCCPALQRRQRKRTAILRHGDGACRHGRPASVAVRLMPGAAGAARHASTTTSMPCWERWEESFFQLENDGFGAVVQIAIVTSLPPCSTRAVPVGSCLAVCALPSPFAVLPACCLSSWPIFAG